MLPFAVLSKTENPVDVLQQVSKQIETIGDRTEQVNLTATTAILAGLVLDKIMIRRILREEIMKESVIYQEIQAIGKAEGKAKGIVEGEANLILRQLQRRFGEIPVNLTLDKFLIPLYSAFILNLNLKKSLFPADTIH